MVHYSCRKDRRYDREGLSLDGEMTGSGSAGETGGETGESESETARPRLRSGLGKARIPNATTASMHGITVKAGEGRRERECASELGAG